MSFVESPRFPDRIGYGASGGPMFQTSIVALESGHEQRIKRWSAERRRYELAHAAKTPVHLRELLAFFLTVAQGRAYGFRFRDWSDYSLTTADGLLGGGIGTGLPTYQFSKRYTSGTNIYDRAIRKPVASTVAAYRNAGALVVGAGAGQIEIDTTTGVVTFTADATANASSITAGATTQVVLASNPGGLVAGKLLYLSGFAGAHASLVNGLAHTINSVAGAGPYTFTLATNTAGKTITLGAGRGDKYPQPSDVLTWAGEFDVPVRFDSDEFLSAIEAPTAYSFASIPLIEVRT